MISHEAREVPTKLELWGAVNTTVHHQSKLSGGSPSLSPMIYALFPSKT